MKRVYSGCFALMGAAFLVLFSLKQAEASHVYATAPVNLRAGPGTGYPVLARIYANSPVQIFGCLDGWSWCDVSWRGHRGWVSGDYVRGAYDGQRIPIYDYGPRTSVPVVDFDERNYWRTHYRNRPFYRNHRWHDEDRYSRQRDDQIIWDDQDNHYDGGYHSDRNYGYWRRH